MSKRFTILQHFNDLRTSYWFVPATMILAAVVLAVSMQILDGSLERNSIPNLRWIYEIGPAGARTILSTIAGSTITVTGVIFSITIVTLSMASSQFGPRLIRNFMRAGGTQFALGLFMACFVYCLLTLTRIPADEDFLNTPYFSVVIGVIFGILSFAALIYYIHYVSTFIQAPRIIEHVAAELHSAIERIFPASGSAEETGKQSPGDLPHQQDICVDQAGYLQTIELDTLLGMAAERDWYVEVLVRVGHFCVPGEPLLRISSDRALDEDDRRKCLDAIGLGSQRTPTQDPEFALNQLVEVALRALSPGINDPFTAMNCIDRIGAALGFLASRYPPAREFVDDESVVRLIREIDDCETLVHSAFDQLRQQARGKVSVSMRLLEAIHQVTHADIVQDVAECLRREADLIVQGLEEVDAEYDRRAIKRRHRQVLESMARIETRNPSDPRVVRLGHGDENTH